MPRNRRPQDREEKLAEIVGAAVAQFSEAGFEQTSMARIAAAAGVTPNTIYWYVEDKDHLLVAALDRLLSEALSDLDAVAEEPLLEQAIFAVERLQQHRSLVGVVHARAERSPVVATWHDGFHALMDAMVSTRLAAEGVTEPRRTATARLATFAVEGLLAHPVGLAETKAVLELVLGAPGRGVRA